jgi:hypothetical protein
MSASPAMGPVGAAAIALIGSTVLVACSSPSSAPATPLTPATTAAPTSSVSSSASPDPTASARRDVLDTYRRYWAAQVQAQARPTDPVPADLRTYAVDKALTDVESTVLLYRQQGIELRGEPVLSPTVTALALEPARAGISDCVDSTHWTPVFTATGKSALAPGQPTRVVFESTATVYAGRWVIRSSTVHRDRTC